MADSWMKGEGNWGNLLKYLAQDCQLESSCNMSCNILFGLLILESPPKKRIGLLFPRKSTALVFFLYNLKIGGCVFLNQRRLGCGLIVWEEERSISCGTRKKRRVESKKTSALGKPTIRKPNLWWAFKANWTINSGMFHTPKVKLRKVPCSQNKKKTSLKFVALQS